MALPAANPPDNLMKNRPRVISRKGTETGFE